MCGVPDSSEGREVIHSRSNVDTPKLQVSDEVIAEMLARVTVGWIMSGVLLGRPEIMAEFAKDTVSSLLQFKR